MSYRIDIQDSLTLQGMRTGKPVAKMETTVEISESRWNNGRELKPKLLWGPVIMEHTGIADLMIKMAPFIEDVILSHKAGEPTQLVRPA